MATSQYDEALRRAKSLSAVDQKRLLAELNSSEGPVQLQSASILDLQGLGKEVWVGIDTEEYLDRERQSWDQ